MITKFEILDNKNLPVDWWGKVEGLRDLRELSFEPGLNVLFAPNGWGKSTILTLLARLMHCKQGGVPTFTDESLTLFWRGKGQGVRVHSDGVTALYVDPSDTPGLMGGGSAFDYDFMMEGIARTMNPASSGELSMHAINRIILAAQKTFTPDLKMKYVSADKLPEHEPYKGWLTTQVLSDPKDPARLRNTILLDEFDRSLDIPMAAHIWSLLSRRAAMRHQLITAGHSPMLLKLADAGLCNLIDLCPGYVEACRKAGENFAAGCEDPAGKIFPMPFEWRQKKPKED